MDDSPVSNRIIALTRLFRLFRLRSIATAFLTGFLSVMSGGFAGGSPLTVGNFSFEDIVLSDGTYTVNSLGSQVFTGAALPSQTGYFAPYNSTTNQFPLGFTEGANVAYLNTGSFSQTLATNLVTNTQCFLSVDVDDRLDVSLAMWSLIMSG